MFRRLERQYKWKSQEDRTTTGTNDAHKASNKARRCQGNRPFHCFDARRAAAHEATNHEPRHIEAVCCQVLTRQSCQGACTCDLQHEVLSTSCIYHDETSSVAGRGNLEAGLAAAVRAVVKLSKHPKWKTFRYSTAPQICTHLMRTQIISSLYCCAQCQPIASTYIFVPMWPSFLLPDFRCSLAFSASTLTAR